MTKKRTEEQDILFLKEILNTIVDERINILPTEYIERIRYIPKNLSPKPGYFEFSFTPYWIEVFNCLASDSGIQILAIMKAAQIGYTVAILENAILYFMGCNPRTVQFITADNSLAEETVKDRINPMIKHSGLEHLIFSQSKTKGSRDTGNTVRHKEYPGGSINFTGAKNDDAFRGRTKQVTLGDEVDTFKDSKKEGSKVGLITNRSNAFAATRKLVWGSTPLITQTSVIYDLYKQGDQRNYNIHCPRCGELIVLKWHGITEDGFKYGVDFQHENGIPIYDTVHYKCQICKGEFKNYEKSQFILDGSGIWIPTAKSSDPKMRSYWLSALYSPPGVYSWEDIAKDWSKAWDLTNNKIKDIMQYREFRNTKQGLPFEEKGESISYDKAVIHRRKYAKGTIDNIQAVEDCGSPILLVLCSVDVQKNNLYVDIKGYCKNGVTYTIDFFSIDGATEDYDGQCWKDLDDLLVNKVYIANDGKKYRISYTFVDSGHFTDYVYKFCSQYTGSVFPIKGDRRVKGTYKQFSKEVLLKSQCSTGYTINITHFKDFIANSMQKLEWKTDQKQPPWYPNFPENLRDDYFNQFAAESKVDVTDTVTGKWKESFWKQIGGRDNHAFDTYVYNLCLLTLVMDVVCINDLQLEVTDQIIFWNYLEEGIFYES